MLFRSGNPLAGEIRFEIEGEPSGSTIDINLSATNDEGQSTLTLVAGENEATFRIKAFAELADPTRSEERRVGKECRTRWEPNH